MDTGFYIYLVALLAIIYSLVVRKIQFKYGNQKEMQTLNEESKKLNEEYKKANARKDTKEMERVMARQMEVFSKIWKMTLSQFKTLIPILVIFFVFTWTVGYFDPTTKDDVTLELKDNGIGCDAITNDFIYSACYALPASASGAWMVDVKAYNGDSSIGENYTQFVVGNGNIKDEYTKQATGKAPFISLDKTAYNPGDTVKITAKLAEGTSAKATLNSGTWFYVDLPFTIPLLNIKRLNEVYWWFIFVTIISGLLISFVAGKIPMVREWLS